MPTNVATEHEPNHPPFRVRVIDLDTDSPLESIEFLMCFARSFARLALGEASRQTLCRAEVVAEWLYRRVPTGLPNCELPEVVEVTAERAAVGLCPRCGWVDRRIELSTERWALCDFHRLRWCVERNLSPKRDVNVLPDWWLDARHLGSYREVEPVRVSDPCGSSGPNSLRHGE